MENAPETKEKPSLSEVPAAASEVPYGEDESAEEPTTPSGSGIAALRRAWSAVAVVFLAVFLLLAAAYALSPAFRQKSAEIIAKARSREITAEPITEAVPEIIEGRNPGWLPEGTWELTFDEPNPMLAMKIYTRPDGAFIEITECVSGTIISIDTEDAEIREDIIVSGHSSVLSVKEAQIHLVWEDEEAQRYYVVCIAGAPELTDPAIILRIAENLD